MCSQMQNIQEVVCIVRIFQRCVEGCRCVMLRGVGV
jgi:hypothetical protein